MKTNTITSVTMNTLTMPVLTSSSTHDFSYDGNMISVDTSKLLLKKNVYTKNFYGSKSALIIFESMLNIHMEEETMTKNSDTFKEALHFYGQIDAGSSESSFANQRVKLFSDSGSWLGKGLLLFNHNGKLLMDTITFNGNFFMEDNEDETGQERCLLFCIE